MAAQAIGVFFHSGKRKEIHGRRRSLSKPPGLAPLRAAAHIEVLHSVHGLEKADLENAAWTEIDGVTYRLLDPVTMLKAKAANVRDIRQDDVPPRNDRAHLSIIAKCVPRYLADIKLKAEVSPDFERTAVEIFMRLYRTLQDPKFAPTFRAEGIPPSDLLPADLRQGLGERMAKLHAFQWPLVEKAAAARPSSRITL